MVQEYEEILFPESDQLVWPSVHAVVNFIPVSEVASCLVTLKLNLNNINKKRNSLYKKSYNKGNYYYF